MGGCDTRNFNLLHSPLKVKVRKRISHSSLKGIFLTVSDRQLRPQHIPRPTQPRWSSASSSRRFSSSRLTPSPPWLRPAHLILNFTISAVTQRPRHHSHSRFTTTPLSTLPITTNPPTMALRRTTGPSPGCPTSASTRSPWVLRRSSPATSARVPPPANPKAPAEVSPPPPSGKSASTSPRSPSALLRRPFSSTSTPAPSVSGC